jgi:hypothetical protein
MKMKPTTLLRTALVRLVLPCRRPIMVVAKYHDMGADPEINCPTGVQAQGGNQARIIFRPKVVSHRIMRRGPQTPHGK